MDRNDIRSHHNSLNDKKASKGPNTDYLDADNNDAYQEYVLQSRDNNKYLNEHEYFLKAKASMQKFHHDRVSKVWTPSIYLYLSFFPPLSDINEQ